MNLVLAPGPRDAGRMTQYSVNPAAVKNIKKLIKSGKVVRDKNGDWAQAQPSPKQGTAVIKKKGLKEFAKWNIAVDKSKDKDEKGRYRFPVGDFKKVHRSGVIAARVRASQFHHRKVEKACIELEELIDKKAK